MTWGDLLDPVSKGDQEEPPAQDESILAALLVGEERGHHPDRLARALGWDLTRLDDAAKTLDDRLRAIGMRVHRSSNGLSVRPLGLRAEPARTRLQQIRDDEETINSGMARVLYEAWAGTLSRRETKNDHTVKIAALLNRGAIAVSTAAEEQYVVTPDVEFTFDF